MIVSIYALMFNKYKSKLCIPDGGSLIFNLFYCFNYLHCPVSLTEGDTYR